MKKQVQPGQNPRNLKIALGLLLAAALVVIIWLGWGSSPRSGDKNDVNSFAECVEAGNPLRESYPEVCATKDGKQFTNPAQTGASGSSRLFITQWGVAIPQEDLEGIKYDYSEQADTIYLTTKTLEETRQDIDGCQSGLLGITVGRVKPGDEKSGGFETWTEAELQSSGVKLGDYYYVEEPVVETLCVVVGYEQEVNTIRGLQDDLRAALKRLEMLTN